METFTLHNWQKKTIDVCKERDSYGIFAKMGTGKTCAAIQIIRNIYNENKRNHRTLILCPVAVVYNWYNEIGKFSNISLDTVHVSTQSATRAAKAGKFIAANESGIIITNYESLRNKQLMNLLSLWKPEIIICDESHMLKSPTSLQSKMVHRLALTAKYRYLLTGTPILNSVLDVFMQYKIMDLGKTFGNNFFSFRLRYFINENSAKPWLSYPSWIPNSSMYPELMDKMHASCVRVRTEECLDLPDRIEQTYHVTMSAEQTRVYKEMKRDFMSFMQNSAGLSSTVLAEQAMTKAIRLQQIVTGFCVADTGEIVQFDTTPRLEAVEELLEQITKTDKCIVWCSFVHNYRQIESVCAKLKLDYVSITGEQSALKKQEAVDLFQSSTGPKVCIANRKAAGLGINLTAAAYSIIYSRNFSLAEEEQANARNYRKGSEIHERIVKIDLIAKDTIDELVVSALKNKQRVADIIVDRIKEI